MIGNSKNQNTRQVPTYKNHSLILIILGMGFGGEDFGKYRLWIDDEVETNW